MDSAKPLRRLSGPSFGMLLVALGCLPTPTAAAKKKTNKVDAPAVQTTARETVFVRESPPREPAHEREREPESYSAAGVDKERLRPYNGAFGISAALYSADVLGTTPFGYASYDYFPIPETNVFLEGNLGMGYAQSSFSEKVIGAQAFHPNLLLAVEALAGFNLGAPKHVNGNSGGLYPYLLAGVAGLYQGDVPNVGLVLGFGQRIALPWSKNSREWALSYGARDHIYSQKLESHPSFTQNPVLSLGLLRYY